MWSSLQASQARGSQLPPAGHHQRLFSGCASEVRLPGDPRAAALGPTRRQLCLSLSAGSGSSSRDCCLP